MRANISFGPIWPSSVGFDNIVKELDEILNGQLNSQQQFPPHNIIKLDDYRYAVELAIAGFNEQEITIQLNQGLLEIKGQKNPDDAEIQYLHKGIGTRSFIKTIRLADTVEVRGASYKDGILTIGLENVIPESKKPRKIEIGKVSPFAELLTEQSDINPDYSKESLDSRLAQ
jgi:molecular chaperone IbpA